MSSHIPTVPNHPPFCSHPASSGYPTSANHLTFPGCSTSSDYSTFVDYQTSSAELPTLAVTSRSGNRTEADTDLVSLPVTYSLSFAYSTPQNDPRRLLIESRMATEQSFSLPAAQSPLLASFSTPGNALPSDISPWTSLPAFRTLSEASIHGTSRDSQALALYSQSTPPLEQEDKSGCVDSSLTITTLSDNQAIPASSYPEHVVSWYLICWSAIVVNGPRQFVPQAIYQPQSKGDQERYISSAKLQPPILFLACGSPESGVPISQLLSKQPVDLVKGNEPAFSSCGPSVGIRINWPGYPPFHKQIQTRDYTRERRRINGAKLAKEVAKCVVQYMDAMSNQTMIEGSDPRWRVGPSHIRVEDILLLSLHHVSQGSWQPQLRLRRYIARNGEASAQQGSYGA